MTKKILADLEIPYNRPTPSLLNNSLRLSSWENDIFSSALDAVYGQIIGKRILFESDLPISTISLEKNLFEAAITQVTENAHMVDAHEIITVNGRCLTDSAVMVAANRTDKKLFRLEAGGATSLNHEMFESSPFDFDSMQKMIAREWGNGGEYKERIAIASLENKMSGFLGNDPYWNLAFYRDFDSSKIKDEKIAVFFPTTDFEYPLFDPMATKRTFDGNQIKAFENFSSTAKKNGFRVVVRAHPHPFDRTKELAEDTIWGEVCDKFESIFIASGSGIDSKSLMKISELNCVYQSSIAIESICLSRPTIILGRTEFDNLIPELCAFDASTLVRLIESGPPIVDPSNLYPWAYYRAVGGMRPMLFKKIGKSFFYKDREIEFSRLKLAHKLDLDS
jgi:hypothetical protein